MSVHYKALYTLHNCNKMNGFALYDGNSRGRFVCCLGVCICSSIKNRESYYMVVNTLNEINITKRKTIFMACFRIATQMN